MFFFLQTLNESKTKQILKCYYVFEIHEHRLRDFAAQHLKHDRPEEIVIRDGAEALDYLFPAGQYADRGPSRMPQLILLDLKLPRIDGLEVLRRIRANEYTSLLPVVILTTSKEQQDIYEGYSLGANSYICKPVDFEQFTEAVREIGRYWLEINHVG